jgi:hypothetical protein
MAQSNNAFIGVRLIGLFLVASNLDHIAALISLATIALIDANTMDMPVTTMLAVNAASLLPPIAGVILWFRAERWSKRLEPDNTGQTTSQKSPDIFRLACFMVGLYLLLTSLPELIVTLYLFLGVGANFYNAYDAPPFIEPTLRCLFGLTCLLGSRQLHTLYSRFRHSGR